jgi:hypothetical protein
MNSIANDKWNHNDEWRQPGKNFLITVTRHSEPVSKWTSESGTWPFDGSAEGPHRWAVYAWIYPKHPHFAKFNGTGNLFEAATADMPLHSGASMVLSHFDAKGEVQSIKVGADYHHLHDEHFTHYAQAEEASEVFDDADRLHAWLTAVGVASETVLATQAATEAGSEVAGG